MLRPFFKSLLVSPTITFFRGNPFFGVECDNNFPVLCVLEKQGEIKRLMAHKGVNPHFLTCGKRKVLLTERDVTAITV